MRRAWVALSGLAGALTLCHAAEARVAIRVDLSNQTMYVSSASGDYAWPISSARLGYDTPRGTFGVQRLGAMHYSRKYHNSPMPHSLFFSGGYAIHGTYETGSLGAPASHGCIRIAPGNAAALYQMVRAEGGAISITGTPPGGQIRYARRGRAPVYADDSGYDGYAYGGYAGYGQYVTYGRPRYTDDGGFFYNPGRQMGYPRRVNSSYDQWNVDQDF